MPADYNHDPIGFLAETLPQMESIHRTVVSVSPRKCKDGTRNVQTTAAEEDFDWFTDEMKWALGDLGMYCVDHEASPAMPFGDTHEFEAEVEDNTLLVTVTKVTNFVWFVDVMWDKYVAPRADDPVVRAVEATAETTEDPA
jgi:hypothetical protein